MSAEGPSRAEPAGGGPPLLAVGVLSAAVLAYEVLLIRLFSLIQWHHFAHMVISLALLGYGASGSFLAFAGPKLERHARGAFAAGAGLFAVTAVLGFLLAEHIPFNPLELLWQPRQALWLTAVYLVLAVPFFFAAAAIGLLLFHHPASVTRIYAADLLGAGLGSLAVLGLLFLVFPHQALLWTGLAGLTAAVLASPFAAGLRRAGLILVAAAVALASTGSAGLLEPRSSPYKALSQALQVSGARVEAVRASPLSVLTVLASPEVPFRHAPGLSMLSPDLPPSQRAVFADGEGLSVINRWRGPSDAVGYLDQITSAAPYHWLVRPRVLVLGAGGGSEVLQALQAGAARVDAVEVDPQMVALLQGPYREYSGDLYGQPGVRVRRAEARAFVAAERGHYDLIQVSLLDSGAAAAAGLHALSESYLYTVEGLAAYLDRLEPGGILAITRWVKLPPRDGLKLFATAVRALRDSGVQDPARHLAWIRSWNTSTLLIRAGPFEAREIETLRAFAQARAFDLEYFPGVAEADTNRYVRLSEPAFHRAAVALLGPDSETFIRQYKFDIRPATDDRPYFFNFFRWRTLPELMTLRGQGGEALLDAGYLVLLLTLVQAVVASLLLVALPGWLRMRRTVYTGPRVRGAVVGYFFAIGLAFLFVEIAFIQRMVLLLGDPIYAAGVVITGFLVFAGVGSRAAGMWLERSAAPSPLSLVSAAVLFIGLMGGTYLLLLPVLTPWVLQQPAPLRVLAALMLIAPLAFAMGMPFPVGLTQLGRTARALVPWAWAVNGCASVMAAVLASVLAIHVGFAAVVLLAVALYGGAAWIGGRSFLRQREG